MPGQKRKLVAPEGAAKRQKLGQSKTKKANRVPNKKVKPRKNFSQRKTSVKKPSLKKKRPLLNKAIKKKVKQPSKMTASKTKSRSIKPASTRCSGRVLPAKKVQEKRPSIKTESKPSSSKSLPPRSSHKNRNINSKAPKKTSPVKKKVSLKDASQNPTRAQCRSTKAAPKVKPLHNRTLLSLKAKTNCLKANNLKSARESVSKSIKDLRKRASKPNSLKNDSDCKVPKKVADPVSQTVRSSLRQQLLKTQKDPARKPVFQKVLRSLLNSTKETLEEKLKAETKSLLRSAKLCKNGQVLLKEETSVQKSARGEEAVKNRSLRTASKGPHQMRVVAQENEEQNRRSQRLQQTSQLTTKSLRSREIKEDKCSLLKKPMVKKNNFLQKGDQKKISPLSPSLGRKALVTAGTKTGVHLRRRREAEQEKVEPKKADSVEMTVGKKLSSKMNDSKQLCFGQKDTELVSEVKAVVKPVSNKGDVEMPESNIKSSSQGENVTVNLVQQNKCKQELSVKSPKDCVGWKAVKRQAEGAGKTISPDAKKNLKTDSKQPVSQEVIKQKVSSKQQVSQEVKSKVKKNIAYSSVGKEIPVRQEEDKSNSKRPSILELCGEIADEIESDTVEVKKDAPKTEKDEKEESREAVSENLVIEVKNPVQTESTQGSPNKHFFSSKRAVKRKMFEEKSLTKNSTVRKEITWTRMKQIRTKQVDQNNTTKKLCLPKLESLQKPTVVPQQMSQVANTLRPKAQNAEPAAKPQENGDFVVKHNKLERKETVASQNDTVRDIKPDMGKQQEGGVASNDHLMKQTKHEPEPPPEEGFRLYLDSSPENSPLKGSASPPSPKQGKREEEGESQGLSPKPLVRALFCNPNATEANDKKVLLVSHPATDMCISSSGINVQKEIKKFKEMEKDGTKQLIILPVQRMKLSTCSSTISLPVL
nr:PREDICTED: N-acetyltransferase ESCO1 isoform X2 [Latimeria chalumnae]|eukprot:XP_005995773.1 PREDICTED: N-acetyltransferase ESCO1 isoform X2 [Latimeria chalumnae]